MSGDKVLRMPIMEVFGPTIQGEGMVVGRKTMFIRTGGCDYSCSWCDSAFTWNGEEKAVMLTAQQVWNELVRLGGIEDADGNIILNFNHVTISGGNPALIKDVMAEFIQICHESDVKVGLETQGSRWQDWFYLIDDLTISPKPPSSGMKTDWGRLDKIIDALSEACIDRNVEQFDFSLKVVVFDDTDFKYATDVHVRYPAVPFYLSVGNPDPREPGDISRRLLSRLAWLWDKVLQDPDMNDVRPLPQLHTLVWANMRAV